MAYKFSIAAAWPVSNDDVYVDAVTGAVVAKISRVFDGNINTTVATRYSGQQAMTTDQFNNGAGVQYRLREARGTSSILTYNSQRIQSTVPVDFTDADNTWAASNNANHDNAALDAHWATELIYDYWLNVRGRNSFDGAGTPMTAFVHFNLPNGNYNGVDTYPTGIDNSFWDGNEVLLCDGQTAFLNLTSFDVVAHEFGHGFTQFAQPVAILVNADGLHPEARALNEGISDIWGAVIENAMTTGKQTWKIGEEVMKDGRPCLRSLMNPTSDGDPAAGYPDVYHGTFWDYNNEPHTNSTVISHWFYLLSQGGSGINSLGNTYNVTGIGIAKAASIVWYAEQNFLGPNSQYADARTAMIAAAAALDCANTTNLVASVTNAWYAVGVG
ncbi:MAG TPA: M4 family metallopeptidase, partial [Chitinophagaceae bacterium]|nr:M4 family metallopeptidase [Chitinophagaceae bacterium]